MTIKRKSKMRLLCFHPKDAIAFTEALRERWPTIRFRKFDYTKLQNGPESERRADWKNIDEYSSLADSDEILTQVWVTPPNWRARWSRTKNKSGVYVIENKPKLQFIYERSTIHRLYRHDGTLIAENADLYPGRIWAYFDADDKEHEKFLNAVWRIIPKLSTNLIKVLNPETDELFDPAQRSDLWFGFHALDWCREDPKRRLDRNKLPVD